MKTKNILAVLCLASLITLAGCGGRTANPIATKEVGDKEMECEDIEAEMSELDRRARRLISEQSAKTGKNAALGVGGLFIFPIWFFMDLSDAERQEATAMQDRQAHLQRIFNRKDCDEQ